MGNQNVIAHIYPRPIDILYELLAQQSYTLKKPFPGKEGRHFIRNCIFLQHLKMKRKSVKQKRVILFLFFSDKLCSPAEHFTTLLQ